MCSLDSWLNDNLCAGMDDKFRIRKKIRFKSVLYLVDTAECPKSYRKSVLHLLKYTAHKSLGKCSTDLR